MTLMTLSLGKHYEAHQGESLSVSCMATGDPQPRIWWSKVVDTTLQRLVTPADPNMLELRSLDKTDTGEYVCQARNKIGTAEANIFLHVKCKCFSPELSKYSNITISDLPEVSPISYRVYSGEGVSAQIGCYVNGYPQPSVSYKSLHHGLSYNFLIR